MRRNGPARTSRTKVSVGARVRTLSPGDFVQGPQALSPAGTGWGGHEWAQGAAPAPPPSSLPSRVPSGFTIQRMLRQCSVFHRRRGPAALVLLLWHTEFLASSFRARRPQEQRREVRRFQDGGCRTADMKVGRRNAICQLWRTRFKLRSRAHQSPPPPPARTR